MSADLENALVECVVPHFDKLVKKYRKKGDRFAIPISSAEEREKRGIVKIVERGVANPDADQLQTKTADGEGANVTDLTLADLKTLAEGYGVKLEDVPATGVGKKHTKKDLLAAINKAKGAK